MPAGVTLTPWQDFSRILRGRLDLMIKSARKNVGMDGEELD